MKKVTKNKKNWFKVQFKKHPYLFTFLIGWPILFFIIGFIADIVGSRFDNVLVIIFLSFPVIIFFLWFRKNKSKIKSFFKRNKKIFKPILYFLGSIGSLIVILLIAGIIATGGFRNFTERAKFEYLVLKNLNEDPLFCGRPDDFDFPLHGAFRNFYIKEWTQFLDYFDEKDKVLSGVWKAIDFKNNTLIHFNHCAAERLLLKEAQRGNATAQEMLVAMPIRLSYLPDIEDIIGDQSLFFQKEYVFGRYFKKLKKMNLNNPALAYAYNFSLDEEMLFETAVINGEEEEKIKQLNQEALKYLIQSADAGFIRAMETFLWEFTDKEVFKMSNCEKILRYNNYLVEQNSIFSHLGVWKANMGDLSGIRSEAIYKCLDKKPDFSKAFSMMNDFLNLLPKKSKSSSWNSFYPALFYLNGWGDVDQNYEKTYELFNNYISEVDTDREYLSQAYLAYMNFKGIGVEQNPNKGKGLTIELVKKIDLIKTEKDSFNIELLCAGVNYNFVINDPENEYRNKIGQCLLDSRPEVSVEFLKDIIKILMIDEFKNPELFETINYLGEAK